MFGTGLGVFLPLLVYLAAIGGSVASLMRPSIGVYILALIIPLQSGRMRVIQYPLGSHILELILLCVLIGVLLHGQSVFPPKPMRKVIIALCLVTYVSLWIGALLSPLVPLPLRTSIGDTHTPFGYWISFMHMPLLFVAVCAVIREKRQMYLLLFIMMIAFLWNVKNFYGNVGHRESTEYSDSLRFSVGQDFGGSNGRAAYSTESTLFLIALFGSIKSVRVRLIAAPLILAGLYCVMFSYSRGAYLAFLCGLLYLAVFRARWLLIVFVAGPLLIPLLPKAVIERVTMTYDTGSLDLSSADRIDIWQHAVETTLRDPILGVGFDSYRYYRRGEELLDTHNMYVKALVETGVIGLICLIAFFVSAFWSGHQSLPDRIRSVFPISRGWVRGIHGGGHNSQHLRRSLDLP